MAIWRVVAHSHGETGAGREKKIMVAREGEEIVYSL